MTRLPERFARDFWRSVRPFSLGGVKRALKRLIPRRRVEPWRTARWGWVHLFVNMTLVVVGAAFFGAFLWANMLLAGYWAWRLARTSLTESPHDPPELAAFAPFLWLLFMCNLTMVAWAIGAGEWGWLTGTPNVAGAAVLLVAVAHNYRVRKRIVRLHRPIRRKQVEVHVPSLCDVHSDAIVSSGYDFLPSSGSPPPTMLQLPAQLLLLRLAMSSESLKRRVDRDPYAISLVLAEMGCFACHQPEWFRLTQDVLRGGFDGAMKVALGHEAAPGFPLLEADPEAEAQLHGPMGVVAAAPTGWGKLLDDFLPHGSKSKSLNLLPSFLRRNQGDDEH